MRRLIFLTLATCSLQSFAQGYESAEEKQRFCRQTGELWREAFEDDTVMGKTAAELEAQKAAGKLSEKAHMHLTLILIYAKSSRFSTGQDAYMAGWSRCMDGKTP